MTWQQRDDSVPGKIYLMKAIGFGGIIPGCLIGRYKIGLNRNPEARLDQLHSAQPCCDIEIVHTVDVEDMVEDIYTANGKVRSQLIIRNSNTKGKLATRTIPVIEDLRQILSNYYPQAGEVYLFSI